MNHIKKYWGWYLLAAAAAAYVITSLVKNEWNPMNWFSTPGAQRGKAIEECINGTLYISACPGCPSKAIGTCGLKP